MSSMSPNAKAYGITINLWSSADKYAQACGFPRSLGFLLHIWCGFYYCISDIIRKNNLESLVFNHFPGVTRHFFSISKQEEDMLAFVCDERDNILSKLKAEGINPLTQDGILDVQKSIFVLASLYSGDEIFLADAAQELQFVISLTQLTSTVCVLLSDAPKSDKPSPAATNTSVQAKESDHRNSNPSRNDSSRVSFPPGLKTLVCFLLVVSIAAFAVAAVVNNYQQSLTYSSSSSRSNDSVSETEHTLRAYLQPHNGRIYIRSKERALAPFSVYTSTGKDYYICLADPKTNKIEMSFYVRGGSIVSVDVPLGTYEVFYATGTTWYGKEDLFGPETSYYKCDKDFSFYQTGTSYSGWELTLYAVENGNMDSDSISSSQFPQ